MPVSLKGKNVNLSNIKKLLKKAANDEYVESMYIIFSALLKNDDLVPSLRCKNDVEIDKYLQKWVKAYLGGFNNMPSKRAGKAPGTIPDGIVGYLYSKTHKLSPELLEVIVKGHSTMMTLENIVGDLLEEYLAEELKSYGWHACWGQCIKAVDFCHKDGRLLQVKTSDNSENSSSNKIRTGTEIIAWKRRKSTKKDVFFWTELVNITGNKNLSEEGFKKFVDKVLEKNKKVVYIEGDKRDIEAK